MNTLTALVALLVPATPAADTTYSELVAAFAAETEQYRQAEGVVPALLPDVSPLHARFLAAAERHAGTEVSLRFLGWLLQNSPRNPDAHGFAVEAIDALAKKKAKRFKAADTKDLYKASRTAVRHLKYNTVSDAVFAQTLLDAKLLTRARDKKVREAAKRSVFKLERLQIGMVAPDIVAKDLDGKKFKLSDYRGKVVVIDFWGSW